MIKLIFSRHEGNPGFSGQAKYNHKRLCKRTAGGSELVRGVLVGAEVGAARKGW